MCQKALPPQKGAAKGPILFLFWLLSQEFPPVECVMEVAGDTLLFLVGGDRAGLALAPHLSVFLSLSIRKPSL